jgi:hypothetical protein
MQCNAMQRKTPKQPRRLLAGLATRMCEIYFKKTPSKSEKSTRGCTSVRKSICACLVAYTPASACVCVVVVYKIQKRHKAHTQRERETHTKATNAIVHPCESID